MMYTNFGTVGIPGKATAIPLLCPLSVRLPALQGDRTADLPYLSSYPSSSSFPLHSFTRRGSAPGVSKHTLSGSIPRSFDRCWTLAGQSYHDVLLHLHIFVDYVFIFFLRGSCSWWSAPRRRCFTRRVCCYLHMFWHSPRRRGHGRR